MSDYPAFTKIPRLHRTVTITEKIDGTNGLIEVPGFTNPEFAGGAFVRAGSRNRWITPEDDNHGFAAWVKDNAAYLADILGPGLHYGEWWGSGIQRGYGLTKGEKRFSLFNTKRWADVDLSAAPGLGVVPVLATGDAVLFSEAWDPTTATLSDLVSRSLYELRVEGSKAAPGFATPEGIVVWHHAAQQYFKVTLDGDAQPKSKV